MSELIGPDGLARCPWANSTADYIEYHDVEWGRPVRGDQAIFERITLEAFQSGLSWLTILRKRPAFRAGFADFDHERIASFEEDDVERLMLDAGIVRNRRKIEATITNARALRQLRERDGDGALDRLFWSVEGPRRPRAAALSEIPAQTPASKELSRSLKALGFVFVGPTTMYAAMQACGVVDDHLAGCWVA